MNLSKLYSKKVIILSLTLFLMLGVSGCAKKQTIIQDNQNSNLIQRRTNQNVKQVLTNSQQIGSQSIMNDQGIIIHPTRTDCTDELNIECWNTYKNKEYKLEFKYPAKSSINDILDKSSLVNGFQTILNLNDNNSDLLFNLQNIFDVNISYYNNDNLDFNNWFRDNYSLCDRKRYSNKSKFIDIQIYRDFPYDLNFHYYLVDSYLTHPISGYPTVIRELFINIKNQNKIFRIGGNFNINSNQWSLFNQFLSTVNFQSDSEAEFIENQSDNCIDSSGAYQYSLDQKNVVSLDQLQEFKKYILNKNNKYSSDFHELVYLSTNLNNIHGDRSEEKIEVTLLVSNFTLQNDLSEWFNQQINFRPETKNENNFLHINIYNDINGINLSYPYIVEDLVFIDPVGQKEKIFRIIYINFSRKIFTIFMRINDTDFLNETIKIINNIQFVKSK